MEVFCDFYVTDINADLMERFYGISIINNTAGVVDLELHMEHPWSARTVLNNTTTELILDIEKEAEKVYGDVDTVTSQFVAHTQNNTTPNATTNNTILFQESVAAPVTGNDISGETAINHTTPTLNFTEPHPVSQSISVPLNPSVVTNNSTQGALSNNPILTSLNMTDLQPLVAYVPVAGNATVAPANVTTITETTTNTTPTLIMTALHPSVPSILVG